MKNLRKIFMATIKSYTDLEQSKKLAKILPIESADMYYEWPNKKAHFKDNNYNGMGFSCWSLAALLSVLPKIVTNETLFIETSAALWHIGYRGIFTARADNPVDACVVMIEKLHELKML